MQFSGMKPICQSKAGMFSMEDISNLNNYLFPMFIAFPYAQGKDILSILVYFH